LEEALGRKYAAATGDYNPWHLNSITAKIFGFKRAICHGMWSLSKVLSLIQDDIPSYPLFIEAEWKKPMFLPSNAVVLEFISENKKGVNFEMWSSDLQNLHLKGSLKNDPNMKLTKAKP